MITLRPISDHTFRDIYYSKERLAQPPAQNYGNEDDAAIILEQLLKFIKTPDKQTPINPKSIAHSLRCSVADLFDNLTYLYMQFELQNFFGPDSYIPTIHDPFWRITTYSHYYRVSQSKKRNMASQQWARKRIIKKRGNTCEHCGYPGYVELHHIIEVCYGGTFADDNLLLLCELCHAEAHGNKKHKYMDAAREHWQG